MAYGMEEALDAITGCATIEDLRGEWAEISSRLGYACFTYVDARRLPVSNEFMPYFITTAPADFIESYTNAEFCSYDPVVRRGAVSNAPFTWLDCAEFDGFDRPRRGAKSKAVQIMENAADFGFTQGYVIPCHAVDALGRPASAFFSLYWCHAPGALGGGSTPPWLRLAAATFHERMLVLRGVSPPGQPRPALTDRERECLAWACRGKTRGETADILAIGERTVEFHFGNAMKKLGVYNKFHAIAVAIQRGIINP